MKVIFKNTTLEFATGVPEVVANYLAKLSIEVNETKRNAFVTFYQTLKSAGLLEHLVQFLPMYGATVNDCKIAFIGTDISNIPDGATYDKGLNLVNASGGIGPSGKGVLLYDWNGNFTNLTFTITVFAATAKKIIGKTPIFEYNYKLMDSSSTDDTLYEMWQGFTKTSHRFPLQRTASSSNPYNGHVFAFSDNIRNVGTYCTVKGYEDGNLLYTDIHTSGEITVNKWRYFYNGRKATELAEDGGVNMYMIFKTALSDNEVKIVSDAIKTLQSVIY